MVKDYVTRRFRSWSILLYADSSDYDFNSVIQVLKSYKDYAYIQHEKEDKEKKRHYHFNLYLDNPTYRSSLASKLGIKENYIESIDNVRVMNRYLNHIVSYQDNQYELSIYS